MSSPYQIDTSFTPTGDQPEAIAALVAGLDKGKRFQTLQGVTGSGKTYSVANVIAQHGRPALVISHNKTLAAQLYAELKGFFPNNSVEYFVSYYDYYQPEAYIPQTDTYIEKDASINKEIEKLRLAATNSLMCRDDVIIVASVSCIYGLGSPEDYMDMAVRFAVGDIIDRDEIMEKLVDIQYNRNDYEPESGTFRVRGDTLDIFPSYNEMGIRVEFFGDEIDLIQEFDPLTGNAISDIPRAMISPAKHFVMAKEKLRPALVNIKNELNQRIVQLQKENRLLEAQRIQQRTMYDIEMIKEIGYCSGIENYSRHLSGRPAGSAPATLLDYLPEDFVTIIDESHVTLPQIRAMYAGDQARKGNLVEHGFRLPSALDNRPLNYPEFEERTPKTIYVSATPTPFEISQSGEPVQQLIRPTGLLDPVIDIRPLRNQIDDVMEEIRSLAVKKQRTLVTTLTKRTSEDLAEYLQKVGLKVEYLHSEIDAIERVEILRRLREGVFDCLIGINLLREGLDLPEVALVAILDADKQGFLRSKTALIQTAGRAARHENGRVILYADTVTDAMQGLLDITDYHRDMQDEYNRVHGIVPKSVIKSINERLSSYSISEHAINKHIVAEDDEGYDLYETIQQLEKEMMQAADALEFERAATLRDEIKDLKNA
ncbi:MAG: excinuclease ABC subunit UvrB [Kiritimatiellae bacterium]|jgi:excinuclease ABC subunit B|nr:excinuclease ABC subunit UvrB [Kiritimatiellia bacterium]